MKIVSKDIIKNVFYRYAPYETFYECEDWEINKYLKFLLFINDNKKKITDSEFVRSNFWEKLSSSKFTGVSNKYLLVKSAGRLSTSPAATYHFDTRFENNFVTKAKFLLRNLKILLTYFFRWNMENLSLKKEIKKLTSIYPNLNLPKNHEDFMKYYPQRYIDHLEAIQVIKPDQKENYLEIGPGACVNVALQISLRNINKTYLVDLPEQISFGYSFLSIFFENKLKIGLPHEVNAGNIDNFDIVFLLPFQTDLIPNKEIDLAMNNSSFQEMDLITVNNYIGLLEKKLKDKGQFISVNQIEAHYIKDNKIENWKLSKFDVSKHDLGFINTRDLTLKTEKFKQILLNCILK